MADENQIVGIDEPVNKHSPKLVSAFIMGRPLACVGILVLGFLTNIVTILITVSIGKYYELVFEYSAKRSEVLNFLPNSWTNTVHHFLIFFGCLVIFRYVLYFVYRISFRSLGERFIKEIKDRLFEHQLNVQNKVYQEKGTDRYLLRYSGDITSLKNLFLKGSITAVVDVLILLISFIVLYRLNSKGAVLVLISSLLAYVFILFFNKKIEAHSILKRNENSGQLGYVNRTLKADLSIKGFNKQKTELRRFSKRTDSIMSHALNFIRWDVINRGFIHFVQYAVLLLVLYIFYLDKEAGSLAVSGANLISFILLYITIIPIIRRVYNLGTVYKMGNISLNKLLAILALPIEAVNQGETLKVNNPRLEMMNLSIKNSDGIHFRSKKASVSTLLIPDNLKTIDLIKVLLRIDDDYEGEILINQQNIKEFSPHSIRKSMAIASTELPFRGRKVYEALSNTTKKISKEDAERLLLDLQDLFQIRHPLGINDYIGANGELLDALQMEILALARALLTKKKLVFIDRLPILYNTYETAMNDYLGDLEVTVIRMRA